MKKTPSSSRILWFVSKDGYLPEIIIIALVMIASLYVALSPANSLTNWYNNDDGFFYFKVAQNIVAGHGVTFDGINATNGFHPLWMLLCIPVYALIRGDLITPLRVIVILFGIMQAVSMVVISRLFVKRLPRLLSFLLTMTFGFSWLVYSNTFTGGLESALSFMLVVILIWKGISYRYSKNKSAKHLIIVGIISALTVLSRLDNLIFVSFFGMWLVFDSKEDASLLLLDSVASIIIVTISAIAASNYGIYPLEKTILIMTGFLAGGGILSFFITGFYSVCLFNLKLNRFIRGFIAGVLSIIILAVLCFVFYLLGILERFPFSLLFYSGIGWIFYAAIIRGNTIQLVFPDHSQLVVKLKVWMGSIREWVKKPIAYFLPVVILTGLYMIWSQVNFGTPMPVSGQIKQWWGTLTNAIYGSPIDSFDEIRGYLLGNESPFLLLYSFIAPIVSWTRIADYVIGLISWVIIAGTITLLTIKMKQKSLFQWSDYLAILPLLTASIFRMLYFYISGYVHMRIWYWTVETFFVFFLLSIVVVMIWEYFSTLRIPRIIVGFAGSVVLLVTLFVFINNLTMTYPWSVKPKLAEDYLVIPRMVEEQTTPGSVIGTPGGGSLSYFITDRVIVNLDGLMNSKEYFDGLRKSDTYEIMKNSNIQYIYANKYAVTESTPYAAIFNGRLTRIGKVFNKLIYLLQ
jgi:hypothetical protein